MLISLFDNLGWQNIEFCQYGHSSHPALTGLERHGKYTVAHGYPNVWIIEGTRGDSRSESRLLSYQNFLNKSYISYVKSGH